MLKISDLLENYTIVDGKIVIGDVGISGKFGKNKKFEPYITTTRKTKTYSIFNVKGKGYSNLLRDFKNLSQNEPSVEAFIKRVSLYINILIGNIKPDVIVAPKSSGNLNRIFLTEIRKRSNIDILEGAFEKTTNSEELFIEDRVKELSPELYDSLTKILKRTTNTSSITKRFRPEHRKFIRGLYSLSDQDLYDKIANKRVLIFDDIITSGTTIDSIADFLEFANSEVVGAITIIKNI